MKAVLVNGKAAEFKIDETSQDVIVTVIQPMKKKIEIEIKYAAGIEIEVPIRETELGQRTTALKFLGVERNQSILNLLVEGLSGQHYKIKVRSSFPNLKISGAKLVSTSGEWRELEIAIEDIQPNLYVKKTVTLSVGQ